MKLIRPATISDAVLTASNVEETVATAWSGATTYALGDKASIAGTANSFTIYQSLQAANLNHTPASSPTWWQNIGSVYGAYSGATTYALADRVQDNTNHLIYESLAAGNVGNALTDATKWVQVSATNKWALFDTSVSTQTARPESIAVTLTSTERINSVALINIDAATATIVMTDAVDGEVYNQTFNLVSDSGITDWWAWFFEPIVRVSDKVVTGLPSYANAALEITLDDAGGTALCGALVIGTEKDIGGVRNGASVGIQDYSLKTRNDWGDYVITERAFNKRAKFSVLVAATYLDELVKLLASYRATPIVWAGSEDYSSLIVFGFYKDFDVVISYPQYVECSLEIEGLT